MGVGVVVRGERAFYFVWIDDAACQAREVCL